MTKLLIIRFSSIGDIVLTTPVVRALSRQLHGHTEVHYLTKRVFAPLLEANPYIDKVYTIDKSTNEVMGELKEEGYDYVVDLHRNLRSARVKRGLKALSFTFDKFNFQKWLLVNFGIDRMPKVHIVDRYLDAVKAFGLIDDGEGLDYFIPEGGGVSLEDIPATHREGYVAVAIGAAHWRKKPRTEDYVKLCDDLSFPIVLLGGPQDRETGNVIAERVGSRVWNAAGGFSIHGSADLVRRAQLVITPDTGMMHIAAAFHKPIISLWGATVPEFGMYPYRNGALNLMVQADHLTKRPCSKLGTRCKYKPCRCIEELPMDRVVEAATRQIERGAPSPARG